MRGGQGKNIRLRGGAIICYRDYLPNPTSPENLSDNALRVHRKMELLMLVLQIPERSLEDITNFDTLNSGEIKVILYCIVLYCITYKQALCLKILLKIPLS